MPRDFNLISETLAYVTAEDPTNTDPRYLVAGSQNVLIDRNRKVKTRNGYTRLGAANSALTPIRTAKTWNTSTGTELPLRQYDDELEVYLGTVDGTAINAWTRVLNSLSTTAIIRMDTWWDTGENLDELIFIDGTATIREWSGGVAVVDSLTGTTVTKTGTTTFAQNRFYATGNKTFFCVRTGTEYTYTGGESTTTLTGIADTTGLVAGDVLIQKVVATSNKPASGRTNHTLIVFENQLVLGSEDDNEVYISQNDDYTDFAYSAPRVAGEGGLLTLEAPSQGFGIVSDKLVCFAGQDSIFKALYNEITVGTTLAESLTAEKMKTGIRQGARSPDCIVPVGNSLIYLSFEPALRMLEQPESIEGPQLRTLSNPIKPDFDAEDWDNACGIWAKNSFYLSAPTNSITYILEFVEDADGKVRRYWQPPQILPVRAFSIISGDLHGHSSTVAESYKLFDGYSDTSSNDDKIPIEAIAKYAYRTFDKRALLKSFDEWAVEGEVSRSTDITLTLNYDWAGHTQQIERTIQGSDEDILEEEIVGSGLGQIPLGQEPLGGASAAPSDAVKFNVIFEVAKEDFTKIQDVYSSSGVDKYWAVISRGPKVELSPRRNTMIKK